MAVTSTQKTLILTPGECVIFPADIIINAIVPTGDITVSSTCDDILPDPSGYRCWQFKWEGNTTGDLSDAFWVSITVNNIEYLLIDTGVANYYENPEFPASSIPISVPAGLVKVGCSNDVGDSPQYLVLEVPDYLGMPRLRLTNPGNETFELIPTVDICTC